MCNCDGPQGSEKQIGLTDVNFQCEGAGHHRGNNDYKKMGSEKCIIMTDSLSNVVEKRLSLERIVRKWY
jgi:hypothetical protein